MTDIFTFVSNNVFLAEFELEESDMWYFFGKITPSVSRKISINEIFEATTNLDFKAVLSDWSQGYTCELESDNSSIPCILMESNSQQVSLRILTAKESIEWSKANIKPLSVCFHGT